MDRAAILTDRFDRALLYATHVHGGQVRKGTTTPYVAHLLSVSATVLEYGGDEDLAIAALLHDSVEDQGGQARLEDVRNRFGDRVAVEMILCRPAGTVGQTRDAVSPRSSRDIIADRRFKRATSNSAPAFSSASRTNSPRPWMVGQ